MTILAIDMMFQLCNSGFWAPQHTVHLLSQGNLPSNFQLIRIDRFGGVREQTNRQTDSLTDWRFYREIVLTLG